MASVWGRGGGGGRGEARRGFGSWQGEWEQLFSFSYVTLYQLNTYCFNFSSIFDTAS